MAEAARPGGRVARLLTLAVSAALALSVAAPAAAQAQTASEAPANGVARAIRDEAGGKLKAFYRTRGYWPLWIADNRPNAAADALLATLDGAAVDGLDPDRFAPDRLRHMLDAAQGGAPRDLAAAELALSEAFANYVGEVRRPRVAMTYVEPDLEPRRPKADEVLRKAALAPSLDAYVRQQGWMNPLYLQLRAALVDYDEYWGHLPPAAIPAGPALRTGAKGARVAALREALGISPGPRFDAAVAKRVRAYQAAHGLAAIGIADAGTLASLAEGPDRHLAVMRLNLERARLLPGAWTKQVVVDAASSRLWMIADGKVVGTMKVVTGTPETPTPQLVGTIRYATLNPYWNVPTDLVRKRIAPKVLAGQSLGSLGYEALSGWEAGARVIDAATIDWHAVESGEQQVRVRELPGSGNSMGNIKFMFPNDEGIYLHDTPDKALFAKPDRHFSNGCVRLEDAPRLGRFLFGTMPSVASADPEQTVAVPEPVPVYLAYLTASPTRSGVAFVADRYGRDGEALERFASR